MSWCALLPRDRAPALTSWQRLVLRAGDELAVYRVESVAEIGYDRAAHGPLTRFLDTHPEHDHGIHLFALRQRATAHLAAVDATGTVIETDVADLGEVLAAAPFEAPIRHRPPLDISAPPATPTDATWIPVSITTCSDIWLPWCSARYEPWGEAEDFADNRELSRRHTPRLNDFLDRLRQHTLRIGGVWTLDRTNLDRDLLFAFDEHGIRLDVARPLVRVGEEPVLGERRDDVLAALRLAQELITLAPPRPHFEVVIRARVLNPRHPLYAADRAEALDALRHPLDTSARLTGDALRHVTRVELDNGVDRHSYSVDEIIE